MILQLVKSGTFSFYNKSIGMFYLAFYSVRVCIIKYGDGKRWSRFQRCLEIKRQYLEKSGAPSHLNCFPLVRQKNRDKRVLC